MEVTKHAAIRAGQRTRMQVSDIMNIIESGAFVSLGVVDDYEYLLIYSWVDDHCKIAVVDSSRTRLVSLWNGNYKLRVGINRPTKARCNQASRLYKEYAFRSINISKKAYAARIVVYENRKSVYTYESGEKIQHCDNLTQCVERLFCSFAELAPTVEKYRTGDVIYLVLLLEDNGSVHSRLNIKHRSVLKILNKQSTEAVI
jgi:hypothetical protein